MLSQIGYQESVSGITTFFPLDGNEHAGGGRATDPYMQHPIQL